MSSSPTSALAFDFGSKNIGVAYGQSLTQSATPLVVLLARDGIPNWPDITQLITQWQPTCLVVGLPLNMDASDSELTRRARKFGNRLRSRYNLPLHFIDERLSSREAKHLSAPKQRPRKSYKQQPVDAIAAGIILQDFWSQTTTSG